MSRLYLRRGRVLPGPLKVLQQAERRGSAPVTSLALTAAALAAALFLTPHGTARLSVELEPMADIAESGPSVSETHASAPAPLVIAATPAQAEPVVTAPASAPIARAAPESVQPAPTAPVAQAAASAKPPVDQSLFQLDLLPVLQAEGPDLDAGTASAASPRVAPRAPARRTANRGAAVVASGESAQP